jgi:hypothetical protein
LFFERKHMATHTSEFGRNFEKYGYQDQDPEDSSQTVNWRSAVMTHGEATELAQELNFVAQNHSGLYTGFMMEISTYGKFQWKDIIKNYQKLSKTHAHNNILVELLRPNFIQQYKKKLFNLVAEKSQSVL